MKIQLKANVRAAKKFFTKQTEREKEFVTSTRSEILSELKLHFPKDMN